MGRTCDKRVALRLLEALVFQIWLQLLKPREVVSRQNQVLQYCNFTTKPAALLPFSERYNDQEVIRGNLRVRFSNAHFVPGVNGEAGGAMRLKGQRDSYVEIEANEQVQFNQSMTILLYINPLRNLPGPLVHYKASGHGVQLWIQGTIGEKGRLMARFNQRSLVDTAWLRADVLNLAQWNFVGASYDHVTGWATLYHDGLEVQRTNIGKDLYLATLYEVRIGAVDSSSLGSYNGDFACLQFYSKALNMGEVVEAQHACKAVVPLQFLFLNLTSPVQVAEANETLLTVTADTNDNATKPSFRFDFGNGMATQESFFNTASTMYHFTGNYTLQVQAWSICNTSTLIDTANILVPTPVSILQNISMHCKATVFGETTQFRLLVEQGTDFRCLWLLGDQENQTTSSSNPGVTILNHVYVAPATYTVNVTCKNRRSELAVSEIVQVQKVIIGLKILPILPILYGREFLVRWRIDDGTGVVYKANFSKSLLNVENSENELHGQALVTQNDYKTPGEFSIYVAASNAVTKWISKSAKCIILQSVSPFLPVVQARDIEINETFSIWFTNVNSGPEINASYLVTFGDNTKAVDTLKTFVNHTYRYHGLYTVNISAINEVSSFNTSLIIKVHKPVIKLERAVIPSLVAEVNKSVNITVFISRGSDFVCYWQFGDGLELTQNLQDELSYFKDLDLSVKRFINITISARHTFKKVGIFNISATCRNRWSKVKAMGYVTVQMEITLFQVLGVGPVVFGKTFYLNMTTATGTNVTFKAFLDQQELNIENHTFFHLSKVTPDIYRQAGQYNITVTAKNLVTPSLHHSQMVFVEIPVSKVRINMSYLEDKTLHAGYGNEMNIFPEGVPVVFQATAENGSGLQYTWSISDGKDLFTDKTISHTFYRPGVYSVSILVENHVSGVSFSVVIVVHKRPSLLNRGTIECSSPKVVKEIVTIQITIKILGTNSTLYIELDNNTSYYYGNLQNYKELTLSDKNTTVQYRGVIKKNTVLQHVYNTQGIYTIKASLGNVVSRSSTTCEVEILSRPCKKPKVKLKAIGNILDDARHFFRADVISIEAEVNVFCPESKKSKYKWKIFQRDPKTGAFKHFHEFIINGETSMQEIQIKKRTLPFGLFRLRLTVGMVEDDLKEFLTVAEGYIRVVQSPLIAKISGGSEIRRGFGTVLSIDGLSSHDPDVGPGNYTGMQFIWLCRNVSESFPEGIKKMINNRTVDIFSFQVPEFSSSSGQGCYRDGRYLLSKTMFLELTTNRMIQNETYVIVLVVQKGERTSLATHQILQLGPENLPKLAIRCQVNCGAKVNPSDKLSLSSECKGNACTNNMVYTWFLFVLETQGETETTWRRDNTTLPSEDSSTSGAYPNIILKKNSLQGNKEYKIVVIGTLPDGSYGRAAYAFLVNAAPINGTCDVVPRVGHVLTTQYRFWCSGWRDPDGPFHYEIAHVLDEDDSLLYYGREANTSVSLPLGNGNNYTVKIAIRVFDRLGAATLVRLQVQSLPLAVRGTELLSQLSNLTSGSSSSLASLLKSGKIQDVARVVGSISSILNHQATNTDGEDAAVLAEKRKQLRQSLIMAITDQRPASLQSAKLISGSLYKATQIINEVSLEAQEASTSALTSMAAFLDRESRETGSSSVDSVAASMCGAMGNVLGAASQAAAVNQTSSINQTFEQQMATAKKRAKSKSTVKNILIALNSVSTSVLRRKVSFEEATEISTPRLTINMKSSTPSDTGGEVRTGLANFKLPKGDDLFHKRKPGLTAVNQKVFSMPQNYYTYDNTSHDISSPVVSLSYEDKNNEQLITVSNLRKHIEYFLPAPEVLPESQLFNVSITEYTWAYHKLVITSKDEAASIEVTPFNCSHKLQIYVRENVQPTKEKYSWRKEIWQPSGEPRSNTNNTGCFEHYTAYTLFLSNVELRESSYIIGILYEPGKDEKTTDTPKTNVIKYSIRVYKSKCLYWNEQQETWMGDGCIVGPLTSSKQIHCLTSHLTTFGSGILVAPNPLDFSKVFAGFKEAFETGNVVVLFTILILLMVYAVLAVWAWRTDRQDNMRIGATVIPFNPNCDYRYEIYFVTGSRNGSGTTAHVGCEIFGKSGSSGPCYLVDPTRRLFRRGDLNLFIVSLPSCLGAIRGMKVWHDNSGKKPAWFLNRAMLRDCQTGEKWVFLAARWLDVAEEDGKIEVLFCPANEEDMVSFKEIFNAKVGEGICDNHLWFSVAYRPARSQFTRLQRMSCCLSLLFSFMVATAMFYGSAPQPGDTSQNFEIGPIKLNLRTIIIGIESALIVLPINILIVALFRNSRVKEYGTSAKTRKGCCKETASRSSKQVTDTDSMASGNEILTQSDANDEHGTYLNDIHCNIGNEDDRQSEPGDNSTSSNKRQQLPDKNEENLQDSFLSRVRAKLKSSGGRSTPCFPYWCVYVGWTLCVLSTLLSAVFTLFYSMMWGREQSNLWLTTMFISFVQDTLISQPLKVLIVSLIFAIVIVSPNDEDNLEEISAAMGANEELFNQEVMYGDPERYDPPDKKLLASLRNRELRRRYVMKVFTDMCVYVILLIMVIILSFQYRNPDSYKMINTLRRVFLNPIHNRSRVRLDQVNTMNFIWDWTRQTLLPGLHPPPVYGSVESEPFIADRVSLQLGVVRLRQVRIRKGTCSVNKFFKDSIPECNGFYSIMNEDTQFYTAGWENARKKPEKKGKGNLFVFLSSKSTNNHTSWEHINAFEAHHILPIIGTFSTYSGGGYVMNLNRSLEQSRAIVEQQETASWLDTYTRAVHAEFVAYNPAINTVAAVTITFELPPMGGVFKSCEVFTMSMYSSLRKHPGARIVGEVVAVILLVVMVYRVVITAFHDKCRYFADPAKVLDLIFVLTGVVIIFLRVLKEGFKKLATDQFKADSHQFLDYYQCGFYDELTDYAFAFLNFIAIVRFAVFLQFLSCLDHILRTIARCCYELLTCLFVIFCLMMAFSSMFKLAFNTDSEDFKDFSNSLQTSISYITRMVRSNEVSGSHTIVKSIALFSCCLTLIFFYLTVLRSVFIVGYRQTLMEDRGKAKEKSFESAILEIFVDKIMEIAGIEKEEVTVEEEDPKEVLFRAQKNYIDKSQFVRLKNLINEAYTEEFSEDLRLFEAMQLGCEASSIRLEHNKRSTKSDIQAKNASPINEDTPKLKFNGVYENSLKDVGNDREKEKSHVRFKLPVQEIDEDLLGETSADPMGKTSADDIKTVPITPNKEEKLNILEKLVKEKMRTLQARRESLQNDPASGSVEHEIQMLEKLQDRIDASRRSRAPAVLPSDDYVDEKSS